jgi:anti-sigma factor RsiW
MTGLSDCNEIRQALGVYVVGAIDPAERSTVDAHLSCCHGCREELAGLAGLPALLGRVPLEDAERFAPGGEEVEEPPAELLDALLAQVSARRRARRWRVVVAAAAAAVIAVGGGGIIGAIMMAHHHAPQVQATSYLVHGYDAATHVGAAIDYSATASGTGMQVQVSGIPDGTHCQFWVTTTSSRHLLAGGWTVQGSYASYDAATTTPLTQLRSFDVSGPGGKVLVTVAARLPGASRDGSGPGNASPRRGA